LTSASSNFFKVEAKDIIEHQHRVTEPDYNKKICYVMSKQNWSLKMGLNNKKKYKLLNFESGVGATIVRHRQSKELTKQWLVVLPIALVFHNVFTLQTFT
jgi:hypothetical protein